MLGKDELAEAARYNDAQAEDLSKFDKTLEAIGLDAAGSAYVADQRAMRIYALFTGQLEAFKAGARLKVENQHVLNAHVMAELDGIAIGVRAHTIATALPPLSGGTSVRHNDDDRRGYVSDPDVSEGRVEVRWVPDPDDSEQDYTENVARTSLTIDTSGR